MIKIYLMFQKYIRFLRAGNKKDVDEQADTVGCCSLRVEHIELHKQKVIKGNRSCGKWIKDGKEYVVEFDFLGKDSIRLALIVVESGVIS